LFYSGGDYLAKRGWKGDPANIGAGKLSQQYRDQKITVKREFVSALANLAHMNVGQIGAVAQSEELPALQVLMGRIVLDAIEGDSHARTILLDRLFGKVADAVDVSHSLEMDSDLMGVPVEQLVAILELQQGGIRSDVSQEHDERRTNGLPREPDEEPQTGGILAGLRDPASTPEGTGSGDTCGQLGANGQDNHGGNGGYKVTPMEVRDALLEVGFIAKKYQGNALK